jgi:hypothetical protein
MSQEIHHTSNYSLFQSLRSNRGGSELNPVHLRRLEESIKEKNLLHLRPIVVNKKFIIIDGHHRLAIAKKLHLPIFYFIEDECSAEDSILLTSATSSWTNEQYIKCRAIEGNEEYIKLNDFLTRYKMSSYIFIRLVCLAVNKVKITEKIKKGTFVFSNEYYKLSPFINKINSIIDVLIELGLTYPKLMRAEFWHGCFFFVKNPDVEWDGFLDKLKLLYLNNMYDINSWKNVAAGLFKIYNHKKVKHTIDWLQLPAFLNSKK